MASLSKKIRKTIKFPKNAIILGNWFNSIDELSDVFSTLFIVNEAQPVRKKNIIYRQEIESLTSLPDIDFIFIDRNFFDKIKVLQPIWRKYTPWILSEGVELDKTMQKFLINEKYQIVEISKNYFVWKIKR